MSWDPPFPSIEQILIRWLPAQIEGTHCLTDLPHDFQNLNGDTGILPVCVVDRISGAELLGSPMLDRPILDIDVYAADRGTAQRLSELARHALTRLPGQRIENVVFGRARTVVGPRQLPTANPELRRYSANYELLFHVQP